jgi:hypothetical protein
MPRQNVMGILEVHQMKFLRPLRGASRRDHLHIEIIMEQLGKTITEWRYQ